MSESSQESSFSGTSSSSASPALCEFGVKLRMEMSTYTFRNDPEHPNRPIRPQAWRMRISVLEVNNIDPNIFVYNMGDLDPEEGTKRHYFQCVASPTDLTEYPIGAPIAGETPQFFRLSSIDFVHRNLDVLDATWAALKSDVNELIDACVRLCELEQQEDVEIGTFPVVEPELPTPELPEEPGSSESGEAAPCPDDTVPLLLIVESTDPSFPAGSTLAPTGIDAECRRTWELTSILGPVMTLVTSLVTHKVDLSIDAGGMGGVVATASAGLSYTYGAMLTYAYDPSHEHSIRISAV